MPTTCRLLAYMLAVLANTGARFRSKKVVTKTVTKIVMKIVTRFPILSNWKKLVVYTCHRIKIGSRYNFRYNFRHNFFTSESGPRAGLSKSHPVDWYVWYCDTSSLNIIEFTLRTPYSLGRFWSSCLVGYEPIAAIHYKKIVVLFLVQSNR